ncbi:MAG: hypothetical protein JWQ76_4435 [Ramlibacter sp.]|nr:hypothetical protein [Ramlibacter sp.]
MATATRKAPAKKVPAKKKAAAAPMKKAKPAARAAAPARKAAAKAAPAAKADKAKKPKLVRDSYTIPKPEYAVLEALKLRSAQLGRPVKKSEMLRAGLKALAAMEDAGFLASVAAVPTMKTGRPAKG